MPTEPDANGKSAYCNFSFWQSFPGEDKRMQVAVDCNYGPAAEPMVDFTAYWYEWRPSNPPNYRWRGQMMLSQGQAVKGATITENSAGRFRAVLPNVNMSWEVPWSWWHVDPDVSCSGIYQWNVNNFKTTTGGNRYYTHNQCFYSLDAPPQPADWFPGGSGPRYINPWERRSPSIDSCDCTRQVAEPIDTSTGNFWHTFEDFSIPGRGLPLHLTRTYSASNAGADGSLGHGWTHSYNVSLTIGANDVVVNEEPGSRITFTGSGPTYTAPQRVRAALVRNGDGTYTFTRRARQIFTFDGTGKLASQRDLNGEVTTTAYPDADTMVVTNSGGRSLTFASSGGRITQVTDSANPPRSVSFAYDGAGDLTDATDVAGGVWHFTYDGAHRMTTMRSPRQSADPTPAVLTTHYDAQGRADSQTEELGRTTTFDYTSIPGSTKVTDPKGNVVLHTYEAGLLTEETKGYGTAQAATWHYAYDLETLGVTSVTDPNDHTTTKTFDDRGNELTSTDALDRSTTRTYNALDLPTTVTNAKNITTTLTYDGAGNLLTTSTPLVEPEPDQVAVTTYHRDDAVHPGDVTSVTDPTNRTWASTLDAEGDLTASTGPLGHVQTYTHNAIGWVTSTVSPKGNVAGADPNAFRTTFTHDAFGDVTATTDPLGHTVTAAYDANRNRIQAVDAEERTTGYTYDDADQLVTVTRPDTTANHNEYWPDGSLKAQIDGAGAETAYAYDAQGRFASTTDPLNRTTTYGYDPAGNVTTLADPASRVTTRTYDVADQLDTIDYSDPATADVTNIDYDPVGARTAMTDGTGTSSWTWDSLGRLTASTNGAGSAVAYAYDLAGRTTSLTYPGNKVVTRGYDGAGRWTSVTDWLGKIATFVYDDNDNLSSTTFPTSTTNVDLAGFDNADRMVSTTMKKGSTTLASLAYGRDESDLLTSTTPTGLPQGDETYGYTALSQLNTVNGASQFAYDDADNLSTVNGVAGLAHDVANQLTSVPHGGAPTTFGNDAQGNRTGMTVPAGRSFTYGYDQANRLSAVTTTNAVGLIDAGSAHNLAVKSDSETVQGSNTVREDGIPFDR